MYREALPPRASIPAVLHRGAASGLIPKAKPSTGSAIRLANLFAKLKDWRRIATRYDRCAHTFFSAICIAAAVIFWL
jgi:hypothetical protein